MSHMPLLQDFSIMFDYAQQLPQKPFCTQANQGLAQGGC